MDGEPDAAEKERDVYTSESTPLLKSANFAPTSASESSVAAGEASPVQGAAMRTYWWRWYVLAVFVAAIALNNGVWITFSSIADVMRCYYETTNFWVNSLSMVYMATYLVFLIPGALLLSRLGLRTTFVISVCANAAGACLRWAGSGMPDTPPYTPTSHRYVAC